MSAAQEAAEAATMNAKVVLGCAIEVAVASHMGGVGTHPIILHQVLAAKSLLWYTAACAVLLDWYSCSFA